MISVMWFCSLTDCWRECGSLQRQRSNTVNRNMTRRVVSPHTRMQMAVTYAVLRLCLPKVPHTCVACRWQTINNSQCLSLTLRARGLPPLNATVSWLACSFSHSYMRCSTAAMQSSLYLQSLGLLVLVYIHLFILVASFYSTSSFWRKPWYSEYLYIRSVCAITRRKRKPTKERKCFWRKSLRHMTNVTHFKVRNPTW